MAERRRRGFVRLIRAESALSAWTQARHLLRTLDHDAAMEKIEFFILQQRAEMSAAAKKKNERNLSVVE